MVTGHDVMTENAVFHAREECKKIVRSQFGRWDIGRTRDQLLFDIEQAWAEAEAEEQQMTSAEPPTIEPTAERLMCVRCNRPIGPNSIYASDDQGIHHAFPCPLPDKSLSKVKWPEICKTDFVWESTKHRLDRLEAVVQILIKALNKEA